MVDNSLLLSVMEDVMEASRMGAMSWAWSGLEAEEGVIVADEEVTSSFGVLGGVTGVAMMGCCCCFSLMGAIATKGDKVSMLSSSAADDDD